MVIKSNRKNSRKNSLQDKKNLGKTSTSKSAGPEEKNNTNLFSASGNFKLPTALDLISQNKKFRSQYASSTKKQKASFPQRKENLDKINENGTNILAQNYKNDIINSENGLKLDEKDIQIISYIFSFHNAADVHKQLNYSKSTFYRRVRKLAAFGIIIAEEGYLPARYLVSPSFIKSSAIFLRGYQSRVPFSEVTRKFLSFCQKASQNPSFENDNCSIDEQNGTNLGPQTNEISSISQTDLSPSDIQDQVPNQVPLNAEKSLENSSFSNSSSAIFENSNEKTTFPSKIPSFVPDYYEKHGIIIRSHNYRFKIPIQRKPLRLQKMLSKTNWLEVKHMRNWNYYAGQLQAKFRSHGYHSIDAQIHFKPNVILVYLPNIFGPTPEENDLQAGDRILQIKAYLEEQYSGLYLGQSKLIRRVEYKNTEHAWVHHPLALKCKQNNVSFRGRNWEVDSSKGIPELEAIDSVNSTEHLSSELEDYDYRAETGRTFRKVDTEVQNNSKDLSNTSENINKTANILNQITQQNIQYASGTMTLFDIQNRSTIEIFDLKEQLFNEKQQKQQLQTELQQFKDLMIQELAELRTQVREERTTTRNFEVMTGSSWSTQILDIVAKNPGITPTQISKRFFRGRKRGSISPTVTKLVRSRQLTTKNNRQLYLNEN